jgi:hypothetical protein
LSSILLLFKFLYILYLVKYIKVVYFLATRPLLFTLSLFLSFASDFVFLPFQMGPLFLSFAFDFVPLGRLPEAEEKTKAKVKIFNK